MAKFARRKGGIYRRYSDNLLFVIPSGTIMGSHVEQYASDKIKRYGEHLLIKSSKTSIVEFRRIGARQIYCHQAGSQGANGAEYLGFRFDGSEVYLRDSTISRYFRKIAVATRAEARYLMEKYPSQDKATLMSKLNMSVLLQR